MVKYYSEFTTGYYSGLISGNEFYNMHNLSAQVPKEFVNACNMGLPEIVENPAIVLAKKIEEYRKDCMRLARASSEADSAAYHIRRFSNAKENHASLYRDKKQEYEKVKSKIEEIKDPKEKEEAYIKAKRLFGQAQYDLEKEADFFVKKSKSEDEYKKSNNSSEELRKEVAQGVTEITSALESARSVAGFWDPQYFDGDKVVNAITTSMGDIPTETKEFLSQLATTYINMRLSSFSILAQAANTYVDLYANRELSYDYENEEKVEIALESLKVFQPDRVMNNNDEWYNMSPESMDNITNLCIAMGYVTSFLKGESLNPEEVREFAETHNGDIYIARLLSNVADKQQKKLQEVNHKRTV